MNKLHDTIKQFYLENPEGLEIRKYAGLEFIENYLEQYELHNLKQYVFKEYKKLWAVAESYWIFPDEKDYKKLIDKLYKEYGEKNTHYENEILQTMSR
jgi:hypothetical protein